MKLPRQIIMNSFNQNLKIIFNPIIWITHLSSLLKPSQLPPPCNYSRIFKLPLAPHPPKGQKKKSKRILILLLGAKGQEIYKICWFPLAHLAIISANPLHVFKISIIKIWTIYVDWYFILLGYFIRLNPIMWSNQSRP